MSGEFFPRIRAAVEHLTDEQVWWRPNEASNSIGNLLLHLNGNVSQWLLHGVGGIPFIRERDKEFSERSNIPCQELLSALQATLEKSDGVLKKLNSSSLLDRKTIQGNEVSGLYAIYHVVEHFSMHTGQILTLTKMMTACDLRLYEFPDGATKKRW